MLTSRFVPMDLSFPDNLYPLLISNQQIMKKMFKTIIKIYFIGYE